MNWRTLGAQILAAIMLGGAVLTPITAGAQTRLDQEYKRRQQKKNEWRNIAIGAGAVGLYGLLKKDNTLMWSGVAGGLYSAWRYEQDRKSQSKIARQRAAAYSRPYIYRNGKRYNRQTVWKNGKKYYRFVSR
jgi:hypothetical protein